MADFLYGDGAPPWSRAARQARFDTWCCVCLAVSFLVRSGSSSEKGGSPPSPPPSPLLAPTLGWPPRDGSVSAPQLPTPGWPLEERRETSPRQFFFVFVLLCFDFFYLFNFFIFIYLFIYLFIYSFYFIYLFFFLFFFFLGGVFL